MSNQNKAKVIVLGGFTVIIVWILSIIFMPDPYGSIAMLSPVAIVYLAIIRMVYKIFVEITTDTLNKKDKRKSNGSAFR